MKRVSLYILLLISFFFLAQSVNANWWAMQRSGYGQGRCESDDAYTVLKIHSNTTDGSTTFTDSSASAHTMTAVGDVQHDTDQYKFGTSSILFDGDDQLTADATADFNFGTGDWTIEMQYMGGANTNGCLVNPSSSATTLELVGGLNIQLWNGGVMFMNNTHGMSTGTWYHIAVVRTGDTAIAFIAGVSRASGDVTGQTFDWSAGDLMFGAYPTTASGVSGWMDEIRVSKGVARWTSDFDSDLPAAPYCD